MSLQTEIDEANRKLERLKNQQANCHHQWDHPEGKYNSENYKKEEIIPGDFSQCKGSDFWPATEFVDATRDRWTRTCTICGLQEHTYEQEVKKVVTGAKFR